MLVLQGIFGASLKITEKIARETDRVTGRELCKIKITRKAKNNLQRFSGIVWNDFA